MNFFPLVIVTMLQGSVSSSDCLGVVGVGVFGPHILTVHPGTPAADVGLLKGDKLLYVNGKKTNLELDGEPDTPVHVIFKRGEGMYEVTMIRKCVYELPQLNPHNYGKNTHHTESSW